MGVASGLIQLNNISIRALESMLLQIESTQSIDGVIPVQVEMDSKKIGIRTASVYFLYYSDLV